MVYKPKEIPEDINVTQVHPLINFAYLLGTVVVFSVLIYVILGAIATQLVTHISPEMEAKIGQQLMSSIIKDDEEVNTRQQQYLDSLLAELQKSNSHSYTLPNIRIQKSPVANAAVLPGGHILVTTSLLQEAESENELAFVLAHELGHHVARDPVKGLGRSLVFLTVASALGLGSGDVNFVGMTGSLTNLHYSRQQESLADIYALKAIVNYYGHGDGSLDFFHRIQTEKRDHRGKLSVYFSTHPLTQERIDDLNQLAQERGWQMEGDVTDLPDNIFDRSKESKSQQKTSKE